MMRGAVRGFTRCETVASYHQQTQEKEHCSRQLEIAKSNLVHLYTIAFPQLAPVAEHIPKFIHDVVEVGVHEGLGGLKKLKIFILRYNSPV